MKCFKQAALLATGTSFYKKYLQCTYKETITNTNHQSRKQLDKE